MMKKIGFILFLLFVQFCFSQDLEITGSGIVSLTSATPDGNWLILKVGNQYKIYQENFEEVDTFSLSEYESYYTTIYGASRDFDEDTNIEILFQVMNENYYNSVYLLDIHTNSLQLEYIGNATYDYYTFSNGYLGNERVFAISRRNRSTGEYDASYVYRSGVEVNFSNSNLPKPQFQFDSSYPNPFHPDQTRQSTCSLQFSLQKEGKVSLNIFNSKGQRIKTLLNQEFFPKGNHIIDWDATDYQGKRVATGAYLYELKMDSESQIRKSIILK